VIDVAVLIYTVKSLPKANFTSKLTLSSCICVNEYFFFIISNKRSSFPFEDRIRIICTCQPNPITSTIHSYIHGTFIIPEITRYFLSLYHCIFTYINDLYIYLSLFTNYLLHYIFSYEKNQFTKHPTTIRSKNHMEKDLSGNRRRPTLIPNQLEIDDDDETMLQSRTVREIQIASNFAVLKSAASSSKRMEDCISPSSKRVKTNEFDVVHEGSNQQQYKLAIETAILVQKEIEQWENSIRELEAMLSNQPQQQEQSQSLQNVTMNGTAIDVSVGNKVVHKSSSSSSSTTNTSGVVVRDHYEDDVDDITAKTALETIMSSSSSILGVEMSNSPSSLSTLA
jgi:hypothetical protein